MSRVLYTDINPVSMDWIKFLVAAQELPDGDCYAADMRDFDYDILDYYPQCHFFAGIGGWPLALAIANVPTDWKLWTGSCPCQPFSASSISQKGEDDDRHLWPFFKQAIEYGKPTILFGEQVASELGRTWLSRVRTDLEVLGYGVGAADISAAGVGIPHARQRIFFVANADGNGLEGLEPKWDRRSRSNGPQESPDYRNIIQSRNDFKPSSIPLLSVDGLSRQLAIDVLEGFGNAIVPEVGATFIISSLEAIEETYGA